MDASTRSPATESDKPPAVEVFVKGALDAAAVRSLGVVLDRALAQRPQRLVIDLSGCPFLDASGIEVLVDAHRRVWRAGGLLTLRHPAPRVRRLLEIARVDHVLRLALAPPLQPDADADTATGPATEAEVPGSAGQPPPQAQPHRQRGSREPVRPASA
ncbi:STAS domain-containing protein [Planosporangium sp. 12N6]|uniref:STAS domain-containing protein n=1 Tax=Planosporangium spinosum TaxID=3402278 RepID=UPI003CFAD929